TKIPSATKIELTGRSRRLAAIAVQAKIPHGSHCTRLKKDSAMLRDVAVDERAGEIASVVGGSDGGTTSGEVPSPAVDSELAGASTGSKRGAVGGAGLAGRSSGSTGSKRRSVGT